MTTRTLALAALVLCAPAAGAQIISVPAPDQTRRPLSATATFGFLQTQSRFDGQSGVGWSLSEALQYRGSIEYGLRSGSVGLTGSLASVPIRRVGGTAPLDSRGDIQLRQALASFRTNETEGAQEDRHRALQLGANAYITKPIQAPQVIAKVKELLRIG